MEQVLGLEEGKLHFSYYQLVPWISWDEWNFVRESLFSSSQSSIAKALRRILAWKSRGCLPVLVEVTASIIETQQMDPFFRNGLTDHSLKSDEILAMLYSMAIMRLVNGAVERTRATAKFTIAEAASRINLPRMLIDVRHEGSHRDLPSLPVVRLASVKALDWLKSYYWELQRKAVPCQRDEITNVRKQIKSVLHKLVEAVASHTSESGSSAREENCSKKHINNSLKAIIRLYSSFPTDTTAVILDFLLKVVDSSDENVMEYSNESEMESGSFSGSSGIWRLIVSKISCREPELLLSLLNSILERLKAQYDLKGVNILSLQCKPEADIAARLSSLILWLIKSYQEVKHSRPFGSGAGIQDSLAENYGSKVTLKGLLRKLLLFFPANDQVQGLLILAEMIGDTYMVQRIKKLPLLRSSNADCTEDYSAQTNIEKGIIELEKSMSQAVEKLEFLKRRQLKGKSVALVRSEDDVMCMNDGSWTIAKSWSPCPIGMLPSDSGSVGLLPNFGRVIAQPEASQLLESNENREPNHDSRNRDHTYDDVNLSEKSSASKKRRTTLEDYPGDDYNEMQEPIKGKLLIDGIWKVVGRDELLALSSAVRILDQVC
ncbi:hypothetical protein Syun_018823 [Stephania yunnanensis]|uniref:Uncharacterized protein n=1 Tax=Stephania yunnanensis TaxID=152371 RepID=A0AAP0IT05_9MAGN